MKKIVIHVIVLLSMVFAYAVPPAPELFPEPALLGGIGDAPAEDSDGVPIDPKDFWVSIQPIAELDPESDEYWQQRKLQWTEFPNALGGYIIEGRVSSGEWEVIGQTNASTTEFVVTIKDGIAGRRYHYRVVALSGFEDQNRARLSETNIVRYYPESGYLYYRISERRVSARKVGFSAVPGGAFRDPNYNGAWLNLYEEKSHINSETETSNLKRFSRSGEHIGNYYTSYSRSSQSNYTNSGSYSRSPELISYNKYNTYYKQDNYIESGSASFGSESVRVDEYFQFDRDNLVESISGNSVLTEIEPNIFRWIGTKVQSINHNGEIETSVSDWNGTSYFPVGEPIVETATPTEYTRTGSVSISESETPYEDTTTTLNIEGSFRHYQSRANEYTTEMLIEDAMRMMNEDPEVYPALAWSQMPTKEEVFERGWPIYDISGRKYLSLGEYDLVIDETNYEFFTKRKLAKEKEYIFSLKYIPQSLDDALAPDYQISYNSFYFIDSFTGSLNFDSFARGYGNYSLKPVEVNLLVSDYRGDLDEFEEDVATQNLNIQSDASVPDPSGATLYYNLGQSRVDVQTSTSISGNGTKMAITWDNPNVEVRSSGVLLTSPLNFIDDGSPSYEFPRLFRISPKPGFEESDRVVFKMTIHDRFGSRVGSDSVIIHISEFPTPQKLSPYSIPVNDATGSRYRKVALNGRPLADEKPQATPEQDGAPGETYIDAFNLNLTHRVSDLYMPIPGSELVMGIRRNYTPEVWNLFSDLRPHERSDRMFGSGWGNGGIPYVHIIDPVGSDVDGFLEPPRAIVVDESGISHEFVKYHDLVWVPMPGGKHDNKSYLNSFDGATFTRKHGTTITFEPTTIAKRIAKNRVKGSDAYDKHTYLRGIKVTDRLGYSLRYEYPTHSLDPAKKETLIPKRIYATNTAGNEIPDQQIYIQQTAQQRISYAWDSKGNVVQYGYTPVTFNHPHYPSQEQRVHLLTTVTAPDLSVTTYLYNDNNTLFIEEDPIPLNPGEPETEHYHVELGGIQDAEGNWHTFGLELDTTKETFHSKNNFTGYVRKSGLPRYVSSVNLPGIANPATFQHLSPPTRITFNGGEESLSSSTRRTGVTDTEGAIINYKFSNMELLTLGSFKDFYASTPDELEKLRFKNPRLLYYKSMEVIHEGVGSETYTFNPDAGLALASATDLSGNTTSYLYQDIIPTGLWGAFTWPSGFAYYDDTTYESRPDGTDQTFTYGRYRIMESVVDPRGNKKEYMLDAMGRVTDEKIFENGTILVQHTHSDYDYPEWAGFISAQQRISLASDPAWATDLVTTFVPDNKGRIHTSAQQPGVDADGLPLEDLVTTYFYDLNNNQTCVVDPRNHETNYSYDSRDRLIKTTFHDQAVAHFVYDTRGNRVGELNEKGHATIFRYDRLNRVTDEIRVMDAKTFDPAVPESFIDYVPTANDLMTTTTYNAVNSVASITQNNGTHTRVTRMEYDTMQRLRFSKKLQADHAGLNEDIITEYIYKNNSGGSIFNSSKFQPEEVVDPRGYTTTYTYDEYYRPRTVAVQYTLTGDIATTVNEYDALGNLKLVTDPLLKQTETTYDALNRPIRVTYAKGTTDEAVSSTAYTTTGLSFKQTDEEGNSTTTEYDGAGRPIKSIQPAVPVYSGGVDAPISKTFYDAAGNVEFTENPLGQRWQTQYDARNRPTVRLEPSVFDYDTQANAQPETVTAYDAVGNVLFVTDARGYTNYTGYDRANRPILTVSPAVQVAGESSDVYIATATVYDRHNNVIATYTTKLAALPVLNTSAQALSVHAAIISSPSARRNVLNMYDALGRMLTVTDAENITVTYEYDATSNRTAVIDGKDQRTEFEFDGLSRITLTRHPDMTTHTLVYDGVNQTSRIDELGRNTDYRYDHRHRLQHVLYSGASAEDRSYTYDRVGNILTVTEPGKTANTDVAYTYDALYRIETETSGGITHRYSYDLAGNRRSTIYAEGTGNARTLIATHDALNRTATITESGRTSAYAYDSVGNTREHIQANGAVIINAYDPLNRMTSIRGPLGSDSQPLYLCTNTYDTFSNVARTVETYPSVDAQLSNRSISNIYDKADRLDIETVATSDEGGQIVSIQTDYNYDNAHNRTGKRVTRQVEGAAAETLENITYTYINSLNQMDSYADSISGKTVSYDYDANGNRALAIEASGTTTYNYDRENRLLTVSSDILRKIDISLGLEVGEPLVEADYIETGPAYTYAYDYRTRRVLRDESATGGDHTQVVFSDGVSVQEYDNTASIPTVEYIRGSGYGGGVSSMLYTLRSNAPSYKHFNARGDVVAATDGSSNLTYQAAYEAFGRHGDTASSAEWGSTEDRQQANTKDEDPTGLLNEGFRYRDLATGVFITRDPLGFIDGPNVYTYVAQNPWTKFDPQGLAGYFFGGTGQDKDDEMAKGGETFTEGLFQMYGGTPYYQPGVGTIRDGLLGGSFGIGKKKRLKQMFADFEKAYKAGDTDIDIFGASRGAPMAREFANMIVDAYPDAEIRFLGIFDSVAQFGAPDPLNINPGIRLDIPSNVQYTAHAVSRHEQRNLFPLSSIMNTKDYGGLKFDPITIVGPKRYKPSDYKAFRGDKYWEQPFDGVHSDILGGYKDGANPLSFWWMYSVAKWKNVPLDPTKLSVDQVKHFNTYKLHNSKDMGHFKTSFSDKITFWRKSRAIFRGNINPN